MPYFYPSSVDILYWRVDRQVQLNATDHVIDDMPTNCFSNSQLIATRTSKNLIYYGVSTRMIYHGIWDRM